jgi:hypothetical protein
MVNQTFQLTDLQTTYLYSEMSSSAFGNYCAGLDITRCYETQWFVTVFTGACLWICS